MELVKLANKLNGLNRESRSVLRREFFCSLQNDLGYGGFSADGGSVPDEFVVAFGGIAPGRLAAGEAFANDAFGFAEQDWNVFLRVHAIANEKWNDDDIFRLCELVTFFDTRVFFQKKGMNIGVFFHGANLFDLVIDGLARVLVLRSAVAGDEQSGFVRFWCAREGELAGDFAGAGEDDVSHFLVRANRLAVMPG